MSKKKVGRPKGYKLSEASKAKISKSRTGQQHSPATKAKISDGLLKLRETGAPIELIIGTDLDTTHKIWHNRYWNIYISNPLKGKPGYWQRLHRAVIEKELGRKLGRGETIHHIGSRDLNEPEFLRVCKNKIEHDALDRFKKRRIETFGSEAEYDNWLKIINGGE